MIGPSTLDDNPPKILFHRATPSAWKSILRDGLLPGASIKRGGSDKVHAYCSDKSLSDTGYQSGVRAKYFIEVAVNCKSALEDGAVFFRTTLDAILTPFPIEAGHIVSVVDAQKKEVLWTRQGAEGTASLTGEPTTEASALMESKAKSAPAQPKQPPVPPPSKRMLEEESHQKPPEPGHPPPNKTRRVMMIDAPRGMKFNILTDLCALCGSIVVSGQKKCDLCGNTQEMQLADHVPELVQDPDYKGGGSEEWKRGLAARRKEALVKIGVPIAVKNQMLDKLQRESITELRQSIVGESGRGLQSVESLLVTKCKKVLSIGPRLSLLC